MPEILWSLCSPKYKKLNRLSFCTTVQLDAPKCTLPIWSICREEVKMLVCCSWIWVTRLGETTACRSCSALLCSLSSLAVFYPSFHFSVYFRMYASACIGFCLVWHIWMCLARPKFLITNPRLHNPPLLCNDCCSSQADFAHFIFSCPTPCQSSSFTIPAPGPYLPVQDEFNQLSCETPGKDSGKTAEPDPHICYSGMMSFSSVCFENHCLWRTKILKWQLLLWFSSCSHNRAWVIEWFVKHDFLLYRKPKSLHLFSFYLPLLPSLFSPIYVATVKGWIQSSSD